MGQRNINVLDVFMFTVCMGLADLDLSSMRDSRSLDWNVKNSPDAQQNPRIRRANILMVGINSTLRKRTKS